MFAISDISNRQEIDQLYETELKNDVLSRTPVKLFENRNTNQFRDVHVYDGKVESINDVIKCSPEIRQAHMKNLQRLFNNNISKAMLDIMQRRDNYDPSNGVDSADLLVWICCHKITPELFYLLEEQLGDNGALGNCLQGSSHRIRQIYYAQKGL